MAWRDLDPGFRAACERALTEKQLEVVKLRAGGMGFRQIARALGITREAARDRWRQAELRIRQEIGAMRNIPPSP